MAKKLIFIFIIFISTTLPLLAQADTAIKQTELLGKNAKKNHVLSFKGAVGFSNYKFYEAGFSFLTLKKVDLWGGQEPYSTLNIGTSYVREFKKTDAYNGFNCDLEFNYLIANFRLRWTSLYNPNLNYGYYITPGIGIGLLELFYFQFDFRIPVKRNNFDLNVFNFSINFNIPIIGKRF